MGYALGIIEYCFVYMFRAFWQLAHFRIVLRKLAVAKLRANFETAYKTAQQEPLRKLEMAVYAALKLCCK